MGSCCSSAATGPATASKPNPFQWLKIGFALAVSGISMSFSLGVNLTPPEGTERLMIHSLLGGCAVIVMILLGGPLLQRSWEQIRIARPGTDLLFLLGIAGAFAASLHSSLTGTGDIYYEVVAILLSIYSIGSALGEIQKHKALSALESWRNDYSSARTCCGQNVPVSEIRKGQRVRVLPGEAVTIDGFIVEGTAYVTETALNGEPYAIVRREGDAVLAGSRCHDGTLLIEARADGNERGIDRILGMMDEARFRRTRLQINADRAARAFVPFVALISLATFLGWLSVGPWQDALFHALAVIVVACPCALGLATPIAVWSALNRLRFLGFSVRSGEWIERLADVDTLLFDKTGTLTDPHPRLIDFVTTPRADRESLKRHTAAAEAVHSHPIASLFKDWEAGPTPRSSRILPGKGVEATFPDGRVLELGNEDLLGEADQDRLAQLRSHPHPDCQEVYVRDNGKLVAIAFYREAARDGIDQLVADFRAEGFDMEILTGDQVDHARRWLETWEIPVQAGLSPEDKVKVIQGLESSGRRCLFIGDGFNDGPAFTAAHASLAIEGGNPVASEMAHAVQDGGRLSRLLPAIDTCRKTVQTLRGNLAFALSYNVIGITLAASGILNPVHAALLMLASSATVTYRAWKLAESSHDSLPHEESHTPLSSAPSPVPQTV